MRWRARTSLQVERPGTTGRSRLDLGHHPARDLLEASPDREKNQDAEEVDRALEALGLLERLGDRLQLALDEGDVGNDRLDLRLEANEPFAGRAMLARPLPSFRR